jgi:hypothetical protein
MAGQFGSARVHRNRGDASEGVLRGKSCPSRCPVPGSNRRTPPAGLCWGRVMADHAELRRIALRDGGAGPSRPGLWATTDGSRWGWSLVAAPPLGGG